jgi:hypothetical protein
MTTTVRASLPAVRPPAVPRARTDPPLAVPPPPVAPAWRLREESEAVDGAEAPAIIFGTILAGILVSVLGLGGLWAALALA